MGKTKLQKFTSKVTKIDYLTHDVFIMGLEAPEDFSYEPGQFVTLIGIDDGERKRARAYSILRRPKGGDLELCIKVVNGGFASEVFKKTKIGDKFTVRGPSGHFVFDEDPNRKEHYFVGTGTGVVPLYSMIDLFLGQRPGEKFHLLFGVRAQKNLFLHDEFLDLAKKHPNFTYTPTLTRDPGWGGAEGRVQTHFPADLKNKTFYICGLPELVDDATQILTERGVDQSDIKFEKY